MTARRASLSLSAVLAVGAPLGACYSAGAGSGPPSNGLYYPVGLAVPTAGDELYVVNSDFDLQYNGGTLQSYDLTVIRKDAADLVAFNLGLGHPEATEDGGAPFINGSPFVDGSTPLCLSASAESPVVRSSGQRTPLGEGCAPPVDSTSTRYFQSSAVIGAFATDLQLSPDDQSLYMPVRGNATLTWAQLAMPRESRGTLHCGQDPHSDNRCGGVFLRGNVVDPADSRQLTMPGEPFGMAQTQDGTAIAITHQATQETSLLLSAVPTTAGTPPSPSMQFVLEGVPVGGNGIVAVPHDRDAVIRCEDVGDAFPCTRQAFLETSRAAAEIDLLRYYDDEGPALSTVPDVSHLTDPSNRRPFLEREAAYSVTVNLPGTDQRGIVIDDSPRLLCKAQAALAAQAPGGSPVTAEQLAECGQIPARVFIGSRAPASVIYGTLGGASASGDGTYDPDRLDLKGSVPADQGVSRLYLAPVVDKSGHYALRLFVVCYDASTVDVFDPDQIVYRGAEAGPETIIATGPGPFAMAFDPSCGGLVDSSGVTSPALMLTSQPLDCAHYGPLAEVAISEAAEVLASQASQYLSQYMVPPDPKSPGYGLRNYRFGYLATFTNSYIQAIDLDDSTVPLPSSTPSAAPLRTQETYESVVFTLGNPTPPKGS